MTYSMFKPSPARAHRTSLRCALFTGLLLLPLVSASSHAACPTYHEVMSVVAAYVNKASIDAMDRIKTMSDAYCAQGMVAAEIGRHMGPPAGYKTAGTSERMREWYRIEQPLRGFLYEKMFLQNGAKVPANFAARPQFSADLIVVVKDQGVHDARTPLEMLSHLSYVVPYIELSDLMLNEDQPVTSMTLVSTNMGTRLGVLGAPIPVEATQAFLDALSNIVVVMTDQDDKELGRGTGSETLGSPLSALVWVAQDLAENAQRIQPSDMVSLGAFFPPGTPTPGLVIKVKYQGLPGDPSVAVRFQ
jgi:2-keto-4-pentenoate hydratase